MFRFPKQQGEWATAIWRTIVLCVLLTPSCRSRDELGAVAGTASVDGVAVKVGTIHFQPTSPAGGKSAGAAIADGRFELPAEHGLPPGAYQVAVTASQPTGRTVNDPQRGQIAELRELQLINSPQQVELTGENSNALNLEYASASN